MDYLVELGDKFEKVFKTFPKHDVIKIRDCIRKLAKNPKPHGVKKLRDNLYRVRQGMYRILYEIHDHKLLILVLEVGHRKEVYRSL